MLDYTPSEELRKAADRFVQWSERLLEARNWETKKTLFHYTSVDNFEKILASQQLWLTRLQAQKDPTELKYGIDLFQQVVEENIEAASESRLHRWFFQQLRRLTVDAFSTHMECHVACFAPHGEDFDLWENYGDQGRGVAIGLKSEFFEVKPGEHGEPFWAVQPVTYGALTPLHQFRKLIQITSMALGEAAPHVKNLRDTNYLLDVIQHQLSAGHIIPICMLAKSDLFHQETEIRVLAPRSRKNSEPRQHHIEIPLRPAMIDHILVGENADKARVEAIVEPFGLRLDTALYSKGLTR